MATLPSGGFKPVQPDGFVMSASSREAPKIEITGTDPLCQSPLPLSGCDVALCDRDDFHHHGDVGGAMDPFVDEPHSLSQQHDPCDSRRGFRRSEGGPGKCPSPSRNSPRRHSPVPYSPKRQHHSRTSASSVASDEFPDVTLSPRRHSPLPPEERPCSLPLTSSTSEEFICVSYSDPFTSPTITHTSEAFLAISIDCVQGVGSDDDVEMTSQDLAEMTSDDHQGDLDPDTVSDDVAAGCADSKQTSSDPRTSSGDASSEEDNAVLHCNGGAPESCSMCKTSSADDDKSAVLCEREIQEGDRTIPPAVGESKSVSGFHNVTMCGESENVNFEQQALANSEACSSKMGASDSATLEAQSVEGDECFHDAAFSSDSSSEDEDMEEMLLAAQPSSVSCFTPSLLQRNHSENIIPQESSSSQSFVSVTTPVDSGSTHAEEVSADMTASSAWTDGSQHASEEHDTTSDSHSLSVFTNSNAAWRRASFPFQHQGWGSLPPCPQWDGERRRNTEGGRTPEDFSLPRVVGHPPLHFPHGHGVVLVHCALPSPYDPHLPTPPIVLTPHTSYTDLHVAVDGRGQGAQEGASNRRPDIARSRSFPNLEQQQGGRFHEPHQTWPELGESAYGGHHDDHMVAGECDHSGMDAENSCDSRQQGTSGSTELTKAETSQSLPGSPAFNGRAAVIGRLRRVVERRLSSSAEAGP